MSASSIGSCTNSSYEDIARVASLVQHAKDAGLELKCPFMVSPGSEQVRATIARDGIQDTLESVGAIISSNSILHHIQPKSLMELILNLNYQQVLDCHIFFFH